MTPYLTLLFFVFLVTYLGRRTRNKNIKLISLFFVALTLTVFAGVRDLSVGTDTYNYVRFLDEINSFGDILSFRLEPGFNALIFLAAKLSDGYVLYLSLIALIVVCLYVKTIYSVVLRYDTALFVFITFGTYTFLFNGARQAIAAAIVFAAIPSLLNKNFWQYLLFMIIASLFHKTAVLAIPLYFLARPYIGLKQWVYVLGGIVILTVFLSSFARLAVLALGERYEGYDVSDGEGGGLITGLFLLCQGITLYILRPRSSGYTEVYNRLLNIFLIGLVFVGVSIISKVNPSGILRLHIYFTGVSILLWPLLFLSLKNQVTMRVVSFVFFFVAVLYFYLTTSSFSDLVPYTLNSNSLL